MQIQEFAFGVLVRRENRGAYRVWGLGKIESSSPTDYGVCGSVVTAAAGDHRLLTTATP
jgi:hypothetical protein